MAIRSAYLANWIFWLVPCILIIFSVAPINASEDNIIQKSRLLNFIVPVFDHHGHKKFAIRGATGIYNSMGLLTIETVHVTFFNEKLSFCSQVMLDSSLTKFFLEEKTIASNQLMTASIERYILSCKGFRWGRNRKIIKLYKNVRIDLLEIAR